MLAEVKKCADNHDIKGLRYIFVDSLDVDPTFDTYREDYEYCKSIDGMFDVHREMSALSEDKSRWNLRYWEQLKLDLMKNFSEKRFTHMISVAKVVYADKITRLISERTPKNEAADKASAAMPVQAADGLRSKATLHASGDGIGERKAPMKVEPRVMSEEELQKKRIDERRRALEEENRKIEAQQRAQRERIEKAQKEEREKQNAGMGGDGGSKKAVGIVLAIVLLVIAVLAIAALKAVAA